MRLKAGCVAASACSAACCGVIIALGGVVGLHEPVPAGTVQWVAVL